MATQKVRRDPNAPERQHRDQRQHVPRRKAITVFVLLGVLVLGVAAIGVSMLRDDTSAGSTLGAGGASPRAIPPLPNGNVEPGRYVFSTLDPDFDASHLITIDVPDGYVGLQEGQEGWAAVKPEAHQTGVSAWVVGDVYADACQWSRTQLDRSAISSADGLAVALASQEGLRVSTPTDARIDGFSGTYMERTVPARTNLGRCDQAQFRVWLDTGGGERYLGGPRQVDLLWILDVDGVPLVINASLAAGATAQGRAELLEMVESIQIDPR
jgi:hypothetical protein